MYRAELSMPMHLRPRRAATAGTVPDPQNGSRTRSPTYENILRTRSGIDSGNGAGWIDLFLFKGTICQCPTIQFWNSSGERSPDDVLHPPMKLRMGVLAAARKLKKSKPWSGSEDERIGKFNVFVGDICKVYGVTPPVLDITGVEGGEPSDGSYYVPMTHVVYLRGRLSVITILHELANALSRNEYWACRWSLSLFRLVFPRQWVRLRFEGHVARLRNGG